MAASYSDYGVVSSRSSESEKLENNGFIFDGQLQEVGAHTKCSEDSLEWDKDAFLGGDI